MPSKRKFYRTRIYVEILSETPYKALDRTLADVHDDITTGDCSGQWGYNSLDEELDGPAMARALMGQGSDPELFNLTSCGEDAE